MKYTWRFGRVGSALFDAFMGLLGIVMGGAVIAFILAFYSCIVGIPVLVFVWLLQQVGCL